MYVKLKQSELCFKCKKQVLRGAIGAQRNYGQTYERTDEVIRRDRFA